MEGTHAEEKVLEAVKKKAQDCNTTCGRSQPTAAEMLRLTRVKKRLQRVKEGKMIDLR